MILIITRYACFLSYAKTKLECRAYYSALICVAFFCPTLPERKMIKHLEFWPVLSRFG